MIDSPQGWSAKTNAAGQWLTMDLGREWLVAGTVIQPRADAGQYVTKYTVATSVDGNTWNDIPGEYDGHGSDTFENHFSDGSLVKARYVRIIVKTWKSHISLRADVIVAASW